MLERTNPSGGPAEAEALIIDTTDTYYLLNPDGDLAPTQRAFEKWFSSLHGWQVTLCLAAYSACVCTPMLALEHESIQSLLVGRNIIRGSKLSCACHPYARCPRFDENL